MEKESFIESLNQILEKTTISDMKTQRRVYDKYSKYKLGEKKDTIKEVCKSNSKKLTEYQLFLRDFMKDENRRGILLYHGLGSGKTISSILISESLLTRLGKVNVFLPASLKGNFTKELTEYAKITGNNLYLNFHLHSYNASNAVSTFPDIENSVVIIDEVHKVINMINSGSSSIGLNYYKKFRDARNVKFIFLSGTPIVNEVRELALLINILKPGTFNIDTFVDNYFDLGKFSIKNKAELYLAIEGLVSYYRGPSEDSEVYPKYTIESDTLVMSPTQTSFYKLEYEKEQFKPISKSKKLLEENVLLEKINTKTVSTYSVNTRQACNFIFTQNLSIEELIKNLPEYSIKFHTILNRIFKTKGKVMIYSNFVQSTLKVLEAILKYLKISCIMWTGEVTLSSRNNIINKFNSDDNLNGDKIRVILVSSAGAEGISLKAIRQVHIVEPHWNEARIIQVIGRTIRLCSHIDLQSDKRNVIVYRYYSYIKDLETSDITVHKIASRKLKMIDLFENFIKKSALDCLLFKKRNKIDKCIEEQ